jgi:hypothetical protein
VARRDIYSALLVRDDPYGRRGERRRRVPAWGWIDGLGRERAGRTVRIRRTGVYAYNNAVRVVAKASAGIM